MWNVLRLFFKRKLFVELECTLAYTIIASCLPSVCLCNVFIYPHIFSVRYWTHIALKQYVCIWILIIDISSRCVCAAQSRKQFIYFPFVVLLLFIRLVMYRSQVSVELMPHQQSISTNFCCMCFRILSCSHFLSSMYGNVSINNWMNFFLWIKFNRLLLFRESNSKPKLTRLSQLNSDY